MCYLSFLFGYVLKPFKIKFITKTLKSVDTFASSTISAFETLLVVSCTKLDLR